jgi:hypothetical protein
MAELAKQGTVRTTSPDAIQAVGQECRRLPLSAKLNAIANQKCVIICQQVQTVAKPGNPTVAFAALRQPMLHTYAWPASAAARMRLRIRSRLSV